MSHLLPAARLRVLAAAFLLLGAGLLAASPAAAQTHDVFTVRDVAVDVTAANAGLARDQAIAEGQRQALTMLMQRLASSSDYPRLPKPAQREVEDMVVDLSINQEKRSAVRYIASLTVRFRGEAVRRLLRSNSIAYAEWRGRPVAVLPYWIQDGQPIGADIANPWRDAWKSGAALGLVPLAVPTPEQWAGLPPVAELGAEGALDAVGARFNTRDVLLAQANPQRDDKGRLTVQVVVVGVGLLPPRVAGNRSYVAADGESDEQVLRRAVEDIARSVGDTYKAGNLLQFDRQEHLTVVVPLNGALEDWLAVREGLNRTSQVRGYEVQTLMRNRALLAIRYIGERQQLDAVLAQNGLALSWVDGHWELVRSGGLRPAGAVAR